MIKGNCGILTTIHKTQTGLRTGISVLMMFDRMYICVIIIKKVLLFEIKMHIKSTVLAGMAILLCISSANAGNIEKIRANMEKTSQLLEQEKTAHQKEKEQSETAVKSLEDRINFLKKKTEDIEKESRQIENKTGETKKETDTILQRQKTVTNFLSGTGKGLLNHIEQTEKRISNGFPYEVERYSRKLKDLKNELDKEDFSHLDIAEELYIHLMKEMELGETSDIYSDEIETEEGDIKKAKFVRIGKVILFYQTNDEENTGYLSKTDKGYIWKKDLPRQYRKNIQKSVKIIQGKKIPELLEFPVEINSND